jgi:hypothetical protein
MAEQALKKCFVISPLGDADSDIRIAADFFLEDIVKAGLGGEFVVKRADDYSAVGNITSQVIEAINEANLIVADLSQRNANVYYELGVAHSYSKHVVPMINVDDPSPIPFDNYTERTIRYSLKTVHTKKIAREQLAAAVTATMKEPVRNPVTTALGMAKAVASGDSSEQLIATLLDRLAALTRKVDVHEQQMLALELAMPRPGYFSQGDRGGTNALALALERPAEFLTGIYKSPFNPDPPVMLFDTQPKTPRRKPPEKK